MCEEVEEAEEGVGWVCVGGRGGLLVFLWFLGEGGGRGRKGPTPGGVYRVEHG